MPISGVAGRYVNSGPRAAICFPEAAWVTPGASACSSAPSRTSPTRRGCSSIPPAGTSTCRRRCRTRGRSTRTSCATSAARSLSWGSRSPAARCDARCACPLSASRSVRSSRACRRSTSDGAAPIATTPLREVTTMHPTLRLPPIDTPRNPFVRLAFWLVKRRLGKVITPWRVLFARVPQAIPMQLALYWAMERLPLDHDLQLLVQMRTALANQCHFCIDIGRAIALQRGGTLEKLDAVADWRTDPRFTERERAALAYVEAASDPRGVPDETFAALRRHFDDREIAA